MTRARAAFSALALLALAGCGHSVVVKNQCPPIVEYQQPFLNKLADEVDRMPLDSAALKAIIDYRRLRDVIRACKG